MMQGKETARINDVLYLLTKVEEESFFRSEDGDSRLSSKKCQMLDWRSPQELEGAW